AHFGEVGDVADVPALLEMPRQESLLRFGHEPVSAGEVQEPVGDEAVGDDYRIEVVVEAFLGRLAADLVEHLSHLIGRHALGLAEVLGLGPVEVIGRLGSSWKLRQITSTSSRWAKPSRAVSKRRLPI